MLFTLLALRKDQGLTQVELSELADVSQAAISHIETFRNRPTYPILKRLAIVLDVEDPYDLMLPYDEYFEKQLRSEVEDLAVV